MAIAHSTFVTSSGKRAIELEVGYTATPRRPAVRAADPDECHPAEGGVSVESCRVLSVTEFDRSGNVVAFYESGDLTAELLSDVEADLTPGRLLAICEQAELVGSCLEF